MNTHEHTHSAAAAASPPFSARHLELCARGGEQLSDGLSVFFEGWWRCVCLISWIHGRRAATRHVAARMPADYICRLLLLGSVCAVWEALAKSLPDQGAVGKRRHTRYKEGGGVEEWRGGCSSSSSTMSRDGSGCNIFFFYGFCRSKQSMSAALLVFWMCVCRVLMSDSML